MTNMIRNRYRYIILTPLVLDEFSQEEKIIMMIILLEILSCYNLEGFVNTISDKFNII